MQEGDETANNTSVEETPVEGEAPAAVEGEAPKEDAAPAEDKVAICFIPDSYDENELFTFP